jgi:hypothetical protein
VIYHRATGTLATHIQTFFTSVKSFVIKVSGFSNISIKHTSAAKYNQENARGRRVKIL